MIEEGSSLFGAAPGVRAVTTFTAVRSDTR